MHLQPGTVRLSLEREREKERGTHLIFASLMVHSFDHSLMAWCTQHISNCLDQSLMHFLHNAICSLQWQQQFHFVVLNKHRCSTAVNTSTSSKSSGSSSTLTNTIGDANAIITNSTLSLSSNNNNNNNRFATPCILLGSLLSLTALVTTAFGRCTTPDRRLIAATLHILAGERQQTDTNI